MTDDATPNEGASQQPKQSRQEKEKISKAVVIREIEIKTLPAQRVMDRSFSRVKRALYNTDIVLRIIQDDQAVKAVDEAIKSYIDPTEEGIDTAIAQLQTLMANEGLTECHYTNPKPYTIEIDSPKIGRVIGIIGKLDRLTILVNSLALNGCLEEDRNVKFPFDWQKRINRMCSRIISVENRARAAANEKGKEDEVTEKVGPESTDADVDDGDN